MKSNFEKQIKDQLENREIQASENAWGKLDAMLDEQPKAQSFRLNWKPIGMAASFLLIAAGLWFAFQNRDTEEVVKPILVHQSQEIEEVKEIPLTKEIQSEKEETVVQSVQKEIAEKQPTLETHSKPTGITAIDTSKIEEKIKIQPKDIQILPTNSIEIPTVGLVENSDKKEKNERYVDPEMLLYSIENNQTIKQKKTEKFEVVIIDFNKEK